MDCEGDQIFIVVCWEAVGEAHVRRAFPWHHWFQATVKRDESQRRRLDEAVRQMGPDLGFNFSMKRSETVFRSCVHDTHPLMHMSSLP